MSKDIGSPDVTSAPDALPNLFQTTGDDPFGPGPEPEPRTLYPSDSPRLALQSIDSRMRGDQMECIP